MAHGRDQDTSKSVQIALAAQMASLGLDEDRARRYFDLVAASLSKAARRELRSMDPAKYQYQSDFAKRYVAQGRSEGRAEGKLEGRLEGKLEGCAALLSRLLELRFGPLPETARAQIAAATLAELDAIGERLLTAKRLHDALGSP
jgi:predicted transposase YdaD